MHTKAEQEDRLNTEGSDRLAQTVVINCGRALAQAVDEQDLLQSVCNVLVNNCGFRLAWFGYTESDTSNSIRLVAQAGDQDGFLQEPRCSESIPGLVTIMNAKGEIEVVNGQVLNYFGKTLEEVKSWDTNDAVHPDDLARAAAEWTYAIETEHPYEVELRLRRADGMYRWFHARGLPLRYDEGRIVRWEPAPDLIRGSKCRVTTRNPKCGTRGAIRGLA